MTSPVADCCNYADFVENGRERVWLTAGGLRMKNFILQADEGRGCWCF